MDFSIFKVHVGQWAHLPRIDKIGSIGWGDRGVNTVKVVMANSETKVSLQPNTIGGCLNIDAPTLKEAYTWLQTWKISLNCLTLTKIRCSFILCHNPRQCCSTELLAY